MLLSTTQEQTNRFGHTPVEGRSDGTRGKSQNSPCAAPEGQQKKNSETRIQSKAVPTFHTLRIGRLARFQSSSPYSIIHGTRLSLTAEEFGRRHTTCSDTKQVQTTALLYTLVISY